MYLLILLLIQMLMFSFQVLILSDYNYNIKCFGIIIQILLFCILLIMYDKLHRFYFLFNSKIK